MEMLLDVLKWSGLAGAAALALTLLKPLLDRRYSARWRYWVWLALAALLLAAPVQWEALLPRVEAAPPVVIQVPRMELRFSREEGVALQRPAESAPARPSNPAPRPEGDAAPQGARSWSLDRILPVLWLAGAAVYAVYRLLGTALFVRRARRWSRGAGEETVRVFEELRRELGMRRSPALRVSAGVDSPMMVGLFRPCLLLPGEDYGERELGFVLRHELCHCRRHDLWYKLVLLAANAVHWFNPLVYLLAREAEADLELTCDDLVVRGADSETKRAYSETLLAAVRRQKGLSRSALSTHFYGGKAVMKDRLGNILGKRGRRWGVLALVLALAVTLACACTFGLRQEGETPPPPETAEELSTEELARFQEQLNSPEYNGFLTRMYTDVRYLPLDALFYDGAGIGRSATDGEWAELEAQLGEAIETDVTAIDVSVMDTYLEHHTGLTRRDFAGSAQELRWNGGKNWAELEGGDTCFNVHGDTTFTPVTVLGGTRLGDTVSLELQAGDDDWLLSFADGETTGILTIEDGKIKSFTTPLHTAAEAAAWEILDELGGGTDIRDACIQDLRPTYALRWKDREYSAWYPVFWTRGAEENPAKGFVLSADKDGNVVREEIFEDTMGYTLPAYMVCHAALGMELTEAGTGWPTASQEFLSGVRNGHSTWAMSWESTALEYVSVELGQTPLEDGILRLMDFEPVPPSQEPALDDELLAQVSCEGGDWLLLLKKYGQEGLFSYWQVHGAVFAPGERPENPELKAQIPADIYRSPLETAEDYAAMYALQYVAGLAEELNRQGVETRALKRWVTPVGTYAWDHYDSEIQVWKVGYGIQLADPDSYELEDFQTLDVDGYLSGLEPETLYLILSRQAGGEEWELAERAYGNVTWEYGFCWETWALAHTVHGLDMSPKLNAWPDTDPDHSDFLERMAQGEYQWAKDWETAAREYCRFMLEMEDCTVSPVAAIETGDPRADRDVLVSFDGGGLSGMLLLSHWDYAYAGETVSFWEVTGRQWQRELSGEELAEFAGYFNEKEHNGLLRFPYESYLDIGPYLDDLFYDLDGQAASMTREEVEAAGLSGLYDARKLTSAYVADYICKNFGVKNTGLGYQWLKDTYGEENLDKLGTYVPAYDAWYSERSDAEWQEYVFEYGWEYPDGSVRLDFTPSAARYLGANGTKTIVFDRGMYALVQSADPFNLFMTYNRFGYQ